MTDCPECGSNKFQAQDYPKLVSENIEIGSRFKRIRADHALEKAQWELKEIKLQESMRYLQQKTKKQTAALRKLEDRILKLGRRPYEQPQNPGDLEPGDLLFGGSVVVTRVHYYNDKIEIEGQLVIKETSREITGM